MAKYAILKDLAAAGCMAAACGGAVGMSFDFGSISIVVSG